VEHWVLKNCSLTQIRTELSKHWVLECDDGERIADSGEDDENGRRDGEPSQSGVPLPEERDGAIW